jgi:hypothetical protein
MNNTTSSSSTASNTTPHQSQDSDEPLDGASCSASSYYVEDTDYGKVHHYPKSSSVVVLDKNKNIIDNLKALRNAARLKSNKIHQHSST